MNWITLVLIIAILAFIAALWLDSEFLAIAAMFVGIVVGVLYFAAFTNVVDFVPEMAKLRQTREAVSALGCNASEDVMGTALNWNETIEYRRTWNKRWLGDPFIADGYDTVSVVQLPRCAPVER